MKQRFNDFKAAPDAYKAMSGLETYRQWCRRRVSSMPMLVLAFLIAGSMIMVSPLTAQETITPLITKIWQDLPASKF